MSYEQRLLRLPLPSQALRFRHLIWRHAFCIFVTLGAEHPA